nr:hypothetical protein [Tanacetum cinerariifolium]
GVGFDRRCRRVGYGGGVDRRWDGEDQVGVGELIAGGRVAGGKVRIRWGWERGEGLFAGGLFIQLNPTSITDLLS